MNYGATPGEWAHFSMVLGLTPDLLPVVSNPTAQISTTSKMKALGKTPSLYTGINGSRRAIGFVGWTQHVSTDDEVDQWSTDPDLGICLQTRTVRAFDIDIDDELTAMAVETLVESIVGRLPRRSRSNSAKRVLAFSIDGDLPKRKLVCERGIIEFLATGNQMVVAGTHPSGVRYEWDGGMPSTFPLLTAEQVEEVWQALAAAFAVEPEGETGAVTVRKRGERMDILDPIASWLVDTGHVINSNRDGSLNVECPWNHEHTNGSPGDSSTVWFPAGTNDHAQGHFRCLHGHCANRTDRDFIEALAIPEVDPFEEITPADQLAGAQASGLDAPLPNFSRNRTGEILANVNNLNLAVLRPDVCRYSIKYDQFRDELMLHEGDYQWRAFTDEDYTRLRLRLEAGGFVPIGREIIRDTVALVGKDNRFDSAIEWIEKLEWDGVKRVEKFNRNYLGTVDTPYTRAVAKYMWSAMAGRILVPGVKADIMPVWQSSTQGERKSSAILSLVPSEMFFTEISFKDSDDTNSRKMRGKLIVEVSELNGLHTKEIEAIKSFLSRQFENWVPKYKEFAVQFPRRCLCIGTTNEENILADVTGNRRFAPIKVQQADRAAIERDRLQLWAEARELFKAEGVCYQEVEALMAAEHVNWMIHDSWEDVIQDWINMTCPLTGATRVEDRFFSTSKLLRRRSA